MPPVPLLRPREVVRAFERLGWSVARQRQPYRDDQTGPHATLSVPDHPEVARGTLRTLINKAGLTVAEFVSAAER